MIYDKDRTTGANIQTGENIIEEMQHNEPENEQWSVNNVSEVGIEDLLSTNDFPSQSIPYVSTPTELGTSNGRKWKASTDMAKLTDCLIHASDTFSTNINKLSEMLSKSLETNTQEQKTVQLYTMLAEIHLLPTSERNVAYIKCIRDPTLIVDLFSVPWE